METNIIKVGNSKGIIIPAKFLKLLGLTDKANIEVINDRIFIEPIKVPRENWDAMIKEDIEKNGAVTAEFPDAFEDENLELW